MTDNNTYGPYDNYNIHPGFSVDCVILSFHKGKLKILLNQFDIMEKWMLPGGFMLREENADQAAYRVLKARTGLENIYMRQFHLFSDVDRTNIEENKELGNKMWPQIEDNSWLQQRFVTLGYLALVKYNEIELTKLENDNSQWFEVSKLPTLYSDHNNIIKTAMEYLRVMLPIIPVGHALLPEQFAMSELRKIFETFLDTTLDRRNFQRKILSEGFVIPVNNPNETNTENTYNAAILYSFNMDKKDMFNRRISL